MMSFFQRLMGRKSASPTSVVYISEAGDPKRSPSDYKAFSEDGYRKNVVAYACINVLANALSNAPLLLRRRLANGDMEDVTKHPVLDLLKKPNPMKSWVEVQIEYWSFWLMTGNSYLCVVGPNPNSSPAELWVLRPDKMRVTPGKNGVPLSYVYRPASIEFTFPVDTNGKSAILHRKRFNPDSEWYGLSPLEAAAMAVDTLNTAATWNMKLLQNTAKPSLAITVKGSLTSDQYDKLKKDISANYEGAWKAGKPIILGESIDVKPISWSPAEMDFLNSKKTSMNDVAMVFGVPGQMVGVEGSQTYANWEQARLAMYEDVVLPLRRADAERLTQWLLPSFGKDAASLEFCVDEECLDALEPRRAERWKRAGEATWLTVNEKRELTGYDAVTDESENPADQIFIQSSLVPLGDEADEPEPPDDDVEDISGEPEDDEMDPDDMPDDMPDDEGDEKARSATRLWRNAERRKRAQERVIAKVMRKSFDDERDRITSRVVGVSSLITVDYIIEQETAKSIEPLTRELVAAYKAIGFEFGREVIQGAKDAGQFLEEKSPLGRFEFSIEKLAEYVAKERSKTITTTTKRRLLKALRRAAEERTPDGHAVKVSFVEVTRKQYRQWSETRAKTISRTDAHIIAEEAKRKAMDALGIPTLKKRWIAVRDNRVRDSHDAMHDTVLPQNEKFKVKSRNGVDMMDGPGDKDASPENVINCFLPDTSVVGDFLVAIRSKYIGRCVEIRTESGQVLRVTPNHPVLTVDGFTPADQLSKDSNLIRHRIVVDGQPERLLSANEKNEPTTVEQVFESIRVFGHSLRCQLGTQDLHGESKSIVGEIDVVFTDRKLLNKFKSSLGERFNEGPLVSSDSGSALMAGLRPLLKAGVGITHSSTSDPRRLALPENEPSVCFDTFPLQKLGIGSTSDLNAIFDEASAKNPSIESGFVRYLLERGPGLILLDKIVEIRDLDFSGHVYDLQSTSGLVVSNNLLTSNCRCVLIAEF